MSELKELFKQEDKLSKRLWGFQCEEIIIEKSKQGYGYKYAPLDSISQCIKPYLKKHGIAYIHQITEIEGVKILNTKIFSCDNENDFRSCDTTVDDSITFKGMNKLQALGSIVTYLKRYHLCMLLGLTVEEDNDGSIKQKNNDKKDKKTDYIKIYKSNLDKGTAYDVIKKSFEATKSKMTAEEAGIVQTMIEDKFKTK